MITIFEMQSKLKRVSARTACSWPGPRVCDPQRVDLATAVRTFQWLLLEVFAPLRLVRPRSGGARLYESQRVAPSRGEHSDLTTGALAVLDLLRVNRPAVRRGVNRPPLKLTALLWLGWLFAVSLSAQAAPAPSLAFRAAGSNQFSFDTGLLRGQLAAPGKCFGLSSVVHVPSGLMLDHSMGLFGHYRVFSRNHRYGIAAWTWPGRVELQPDGSVKVRWAAAADRPFELSAVYRWSAPGTLDLETTVRAATNLINFESFLGSYFSPGFSNALVYANPTPGDPHTARWMPAEFSAGIWQVFPRDDAALAIVRDGRWKFEPNPVDWSARPCLAHPLGVRQNRTAGITAVLMSPPGDCFAVFTPHQAEAHGSMYLSLFGGDLQAGETRHAHSRLIIATNLVDADIVRLYDDYAKSHR